MSVFLDQAEQDMRDHLRAREPWTLELDVGLPAATRLLHHHDLDNYLYPLAQRLGSRGIASARARKRHGDRSLARLDTARPADPPLDRTFHRLQTTASAGTTAYKQQIHEQLTASGALPGSPVSAVIGFRCGPDRNWLNLWKPTIDALGPLIGEGNRMWSPRDGAIVDLALHLLVDPARRWDVEVFVGVAPARE
ncbi:hypothetical protein [Pseudonocardia aurantiaca]|uniref:Uncharacterized protein n=1 Tax=Pseudonocardia aurantiaca TaxID=75290 RepID=A0ABW4FY92_9PSEU